MQSKAESIKILDLRGLSNFCDFFIIMTSSSGRRAQAIIDAISEGLAKKQIGIKAQEGAEDSPWMLLDLFDIVVHIFSGESREYYNLDKLWADASVMKFPARKNALKSVRKPPKSASSQKPLRKPASS